MHLTNDPDKQIIEVRKQLLQSNAEDRTPINSFIECIESLKKRAPDGNMLHIGSEQGSAIFIYETRYETEEEVIDRIAAYDKHMLSVQRKADKSWDRQKTKFNKARK